MAFTNTGVRNPKHILFALVCLLVLGVTLPVHADDKTPLDGKWLAVAEESDGKRMKKDDVKKMAKTLQIDGEKFVLSWSGRTVKGTIEPLPDEKPAAIDLSGKLPTGRNVVLRGIYELKDETLRLCYTIYIVNGEEVKRPKEFETAEGQKSICVTFQRQE